MIEHTIIILIFLFFLATIVFAILGVSYLSDDIKKKKWKKKYGEKQRQYIEEADKKEWLYLQKKFDMLTIYEEYFKKNGLISIIEETKHKISKIDYEKKYVEWKKEYNERTIERLRSLSGLS